MLLRCKHEKEKKCDLDTDLEIADPDLN